MSYDQKMSLCEAIIKLHPKYLQNIVDVIAEEEPELLEKNDTEWCFDVNILKDSTLWLLKKVVQSLSQNKVKKECSIKHEGDGIQKESNPKIKEEHCGFFPGPEVHNKESAGQLEESLKGDHKKKSDKFTITIEVHDIREGTTCPTCKKEFSDRSNLIKHVRTHTSEMPYQCTECGKAFRHTTTLKAHANTHTNQNPFMCTHTDCNKSFANQPNLKRHMRTHTGEKPYSCSFCGKTFSQSSNCKQHEKVHEKNGDTIST